MKKQPRAILKILIGLAWILIGGYLILMNVPSDLMLQIEGHDVALTDWYYEEPGQGAWTVALQEDGKVEIKTGATFTFTTEEIEGDETRVSVNYKGLNGDLQPGDVLFFWSSEEGKVQYVGIYIGGGEFVAARNSEKPVSILGLNTKYFTERFLFARRFTD